MGKVKIWTKLFIYFILTILLVVVFYNFLDKEIILFFYHMKNNNFKKFFYYITDFGKSTWYFIVSAILFVYFKFKKSFFKALMAKYFFMVNLVAGISVWMFKIPFGRIRPKLFLQNGLYGFTGFSIHYDYTSFPSGHTITAISSATALALLFPKYKIIFITCGILIAFSRIVTTNHYPSDVIFASYLGVLVAIVLYQYYFKDSNVKRN